MSEFVALMASTLSLSPKSALETGPDGLLRATQSASNLARNRLRAAGVALSARSGEVAFTIIGGDAKRKNPRRSTEETTASLDYPPLGTLSGVEKSSSSVARAALKAHVERLIAAANTTPTRLAIDADLNPHYVNQWLNGRVRSPGTEKLGRIAAALGVSLEELTTPSGETDAEGRQFLPEDLARKVLLRDRRDVGSAPVLPVRYIVQAGAWIEVDDMAQERIASPPVSADPAFPRDVQWLELVRGDSADIFYPEGVFVHVVDAIAIGYAPRHEDFVVVERKRQQGGLVERSLKQIEKRGRRVQLWPRSRNPKWKTPLDLADTTDDDTIVEIAALVLGGYLPARR